MIPLPIHKQTNAVGGVKERRDGITARIPSSYVYGKSLKNMKGGFVAKA
jgi:hypothetical protein